ncbi:hypothetical protein AX16_007085 [Volvariella volvacea WC 439]|nr:hypothetical protein AX16_007085 [Volvariella volvacea WC 439]
MDVVPPNNIGSNEGQYARSSRSDPQSGSNYYSPISSVAKPPALETGEDVQAALPLIPATDEGSHDTHDSQSVAFSDVESVGKPPDIASSNGLVFQQPTEGAPHPGVFNIKVRDRTTPSRSIIAVF